MFQYGGKRIIVSLAKMAALLVTFLGQVAWSEEQDSLQRLQLINLDIVPPSSRVEGEVGFMNIRDTSCRVFPEEALRRRIVNAAIQEWAFFGFNLIDQTSPVIPGNNNRSANFRFVRSPYSRISEESMSNVFDSIAGYWSATKDGAWILQRQNINWQELGLRSRWRDAWSAAFISWVMCESGIGNLENFERAIAHHIYIDQAIRARDGEDELAMFKAYDPGEQEVIPGDLLCRGSRPQYLSINQRRRQLGVGARTHCDIVVQVDEENQQILVIGGNVRETVNMKVLAAARTEGEAFQPTVAGRRAIFAHLKFKANPIEADALDLSPTMQAAACSESSPVFEEHIAIDVADSC